MSENPVPEAHTQPFSLAGRAALVTGSARGLGAAIAETLLRQGASVAVCDIDPEPLAETCARLAEFGTVHAVPCDVRDREAVETSVAQAAEQLGRLDILVNNAGVHRRVDPLDFDPADVDAIFAVNLLGCFYMASAVGRRMVAARSGAIVNMSALGGGIVGLGRSGSAYGMTKGGVVALTRDLAAEWGRYGVRVNAVAPGWIRTPMTSALQANAERSQKVLERVPLQRWGEPQDVAGVVAFLVSDAARYITGHTIPIDGGAAHVIALSD